MSEVRKELEFSLSRFMRDIRSETGCKSLREIADRVKVSASTLSRVDRGHIPDMNTFLIVCSALELDPQDYFVWVKWQRVEDE